jgi:hypothetical protein
MIKYKTIHVDTTSLDSIFKNVLDLHKKVSDIKCPTLQCPQPDTPEVKKYQEDRAKATVKVKLEQLKYMKEFFKLFKDRYIKLCWQGQKARYYHIGDVDIKVVPKKKLGLCTWWEQTFAIDEKKTYLATSSNTVSLSTSFVDAYVRGSKVPGGFPFDEYSNLYITEITKKDFAAVDKTALPEGINHNVSCAISPWVMKNGGNITDRAELKRLELEITLANKQLALVKERKNNFCIRQNQVETIKKAPKEVKTAFKYAFKDQIEKSDHKIEVLEKQIAKYKDELKNKTYIDKVDKKKK